jgi:hypothetical protein
MGYLTNQFLALSSNLPLKAALVERWVLVDKIDTSEVRKKALRGPERQFSLHPSCHASPVQGECGRSSPL